MNRGPLCGFTECLRRWCLATAHSSLARTRAEETQSEQMRRKENFESCKVALSTSRGGEGLGVALRSSRYDRFDCYLPNLSAGQALLDVDLILVPLSLLRKAILILSSFALSNDNLELAVSAPFLNHEEQPHSALSIANSNPNPLPRPQRPQRITLTLRRLTAALSFCRRRIAAHSLDRKEWLQDIEARSTPYSARTHEGEKRLLICSTPRREIEVGAGITHQGVANICTLVGSVPWRYGE